MKYLSFLILIITFCNCNRRKYEERLESEGKIKCGWYGKMNTTQRRNTFPFNEASRIELISYPNYEKDIYSNIDSVETPWGEKLKPIFITEPRITITQPVLDTIKFLYRTYYRYETVVLNQNQIDSLSNLMLNYRLNIKLHYPTSSESCCYKPRNAIIFYDKSYTPFLDYEICFECFREKFYPENKKFGIGERCVNFDLYKEFFRKCNIVYGTNEIKKPQ